MLQPALDALSMTQFQRAPNPLYDSAVPPSAPDGHERAVATESIPVKSLVSAQSTIAPGKVAAMRKSTGPMPPIKVMRVGAKHVLIDGNHRGVAAPKRGRIDAQVKAVF